MLFYELHPGITYMRALKFQLRLAGQTPSPLSPLPRPLFLQQLLILAQVSPYSACLALATSRYLFNLLAGTALDATYLPPSRGAHCNMWACSKVPSRCLFGKGFLGYAS